MIQRLFFVMLVALSVSNLACSSAAPKFPIPANAHISEATLDFVTIAPGDSAATFIADFGASYRDVITQWSITPDYSKMLRGVVNDLEAMMKRRVGISILDGQSMAVTVDRDSHVLMYVKGTGLPVLKADGRGIYRLEDIAFTQAGTWWVVGTFEHVEHFVKHRGQARLVTTRRDELVWSVQRAKSGLLGILFATDQQPAAAWAASWSEAVWAWRESGAAATTREANVKAHIAQVIAALRKRIATLEAPWREVAPFVLDALERSVSTAVTADSVDLRVAYQLPSLPDFSSAPSVADRLAAEGEWIVAQVNAGGPWLGQLVALFNIFGDRLDQKAFTAAIGQALPAAISPYVNAALISVGGVDERNAGSDDRMIISLQNLMRAADKLPPVGDLTARAERWGVALGEPEALKGATRPKTLDDRLALDGAGVWLRAAADVTRAPKYVSADIGKYVQRFYVTYGHRGMVMEIQTPPGQAGAVLALWNIALGAMNGEFDRNYNKRATLSAGEEALAIYMHHTGALTQSMFVLKQTAPDMLRLDVEYDLSPQLELMRKGLLLTSAGAVMAVVVGAAADELGGLDWFERAMQRVGREQQP